MTRISTWEAGLAAYIAEALNKPMAWGEHDCALHFANAVMAMTGDDPASEYRGKYSSELGSAKALSKYGAGTLEATIDSKFEVIPAGFVRRGDGVWNGEAVGVSMGGYALFVGQQGEKEGLIRVPRSAWVKGWRVG